jgi:ribosomal protein S18 acetylase RimI-like enzyme
MLGYEKVAIRPVRERDEPLLFALAGEAYGEALPTDDTVAVLTRSQVYVAEVDDELAGYVALIDEGAELCIRQMLVAPGHEDRSVDRQLCDWAEGYAVSRGFERLRVDVGDEEHQALLFYRRRGYQHVRSGGLELVLPSVEE